MICPGFPYCTPRFPPCQSGGRQRHGRDGRHPDSPRAHGIQRSPWLVSTDTGRPERRSRMGAVGGSFQRQGLSVQAAGQGVLALQHRQKFERRRWPSAHSNPRAACPRATRDATKPSCRIRLHKHARAESRRHRLADGSLMPTAHAPRNGRLRPCGWRPCLFALHKGLFADPSQAHNAWSQEHFPGFLGQRRRRT